ncbi:glycosyltransferase [Ulvibacterium marinum]|uniref:glycosyltransferase n=1 Tax=Ulvibacterium marinum TaxID=2419782 RepID=UPI002494909E|nr:glycosyltransferase [Ulvibacterium marinum]
MNDSRIKITFIIPSLRSGGAERIMSYIPQELDKKKFECNLIVIGYEKDKAYTVENISVTYLNKKRVLFAFPSIFYQIFKAKPDIVFSAISHLNIMMGLQSILFPKIKFIGREANVKSVVRDYSSLPKKRSLLSKLFSKVGYKYLDKIVCQSNDMWNDLIVNHNFPKSKLVIINNPISNSLKKKLEIKPMDENGFRLITVGRLVKQKGHVRILDALSKLKLPYTYTMIGDGSEKERIMEHAKKLNIQNRIVHIGFTNKVFDHLEESHLFLQGSYVEGFPNALLESCAVGTPVIAYKAPGGIDEIINEGVNGFIAENVNDFTKKITDILNTIDNWKPSVVSQSVYQKYSSESILDKYESLFRDILQK